MKNMSIEQQIDNYFGLVCKTLGGLSRENISALTDLLMNARDNEKTIFVFGNGGSGANASHICGDFVKGVSYGLEKGFRVICLNDNIPTLMAIANDISYEDIFVEQLKNFLKKNDVVIGISGSGNSMNIVKALEYANKVGATTIALCGYSGGKIKNIAKISIHAEIDNMEVVEDVHLVIAHCIKNIIIRKLKNEVRC
jgi:D-sedoheptulose 7-phosphate isomerase